MTTPVVGVDDICLARIESTYDSAGLFVGGDAVALEEMKIEPSQEWHKSKEHVGSGSLQTEVEGKRGGTWSIVGYVAPNAAGTAPDVGEILKAGFGTETVSGGTSVTYELKETGAPDSLQLAKHTGDGLYQSAHGAWVEQVEVAITGNELCKISARGGFASYGYVYSGATADGAQTAPDTTILLQTGDGVRIGAGAMIKFVDPDDSEEDNSSAGYLVTAVDTATDIITISPTLAGNIDDNAKIVPFTPTITTGGTPQGGIDADLSVDATSVGMISGKLTLDTGIHALDKEATTNRANRIARGQREISGEIEGYFLDENTKYLGSAWEGTTRNVIMRAGPDTAGSRMKVNTPKARMAVATITVPEADEATFKANTVPRKNSTNGDELTIVFD